MERPHKIEAVRSEDIHFLLYGNPSKKNTCTQIIIRDDVSLHKSGFDPKKQSKVLIHGFLAHAFAEFPRNVKNAYLQQKKKDCSIICVNWGPLSGKKGEDYKDVKSKLTAVTQEVSHFLAWLHERTELELSNAHLVGHSLGAHICGYVRAGATLLNKVW